jgi:hypothetical protein
LPTSPATGLSEQQILAILHRLDLVEESEKHMATLESHVLLLQQMLTDKSSQITALQQEQQRQQQEQQRQQQEIQAKDARIAALESAKHSRGTSCTRGYLPYRNDTHTYSQIQTGRTHLQTGKTHRQTGDITPLYSCGQSA